MASGRLLLPALAVLVNCSLVADGLVSAPRPEEVRPSAQREESVQVTAMVVANEFDATMVLAERLPDGVTPEPGADCQSVYEWVRDRGAYLTHGLRMRVSIDPARYTQVVFLSAAIRVTGTLDIRFRQTPFLFSCGDSRSLPYPGEEGYESELVGTRQNTGPWFLSTLGIPEGQPDIAELPSAVEDRYPFDVSAADTASFTIDITIADYLEPTQFVVDLRLQINGTEHTFVLRDGDQPFTLLPWPGGMGFYPDQYHWCPGTPGRLTFQAGETETEGFGYC